LQVKVLPDARFEREGDDLHTTVPVDLYTAILGGRTEVPTLSGPVALTIPASTQNGRIFRLRGKGMPRLRQPDQHGDLYAKVDVQLPTHVSPRERELFAELRAISGRGQ
jgi:curved DNA-binding protein